jgi:hypothetical protein
MLEMLPLTPLVGVYAGSAGSSLGGPDASTGATDRTVSANTATLATKRFFIVFSSLSAVMMRLAHVGTVTGVLRLRYDRGKSRKR